LFVLGAESIREEEFISDFDVELSSSGGEFLNQTLLNFWADDFRDLRIGMLVDDGNADVWELSLECLYKLQAF
jgi:hypothetical protein